MQTVFDSFVDSLRFYQMTRFQETERSIDSCFHIPYSGPLSPDYVAVENYLEYCVCTLLLEAIDNLNIYSLSELQTVSNRLEDEDQLYAQ